MYSFGELLWRGISVPVCAPMLEVSLQERTVVRVAAGGFHCGAVTAQGSIYMWGENTGGQCGLAERGSVTNITGGIIKMVHLYIIVHLRLLRQCNFV